jgi:hypothetical protein
MSDERTNTDLETRLRDAFQSGELPPAPASLADVLERVPDAPVIRGGSGETGSGGAGRSILGALGVAAVLLVGGAVALSVGSHSQTPPRVSSGRPSVEASGAPAIVVTYQIGWSAAAPYTTFALDSEVETVQHRLDATGAVGVTARADGQDRLVVAIPAGLDADALRHLIGQTGRVGFAPLGDTQLEKGDPVDPAKFPDLFGSEGVDDARVTTGSSGQRVVQIGLTKAAADLFETYTAAHVGTYFAIALDGLVVSAPVINSAIPGGQIEISQSGVIGGWDLAAANELATIIRLQPLPAPLTEISNEPGPVDPSASPDVGPSPSALTLIGPSRECELPLQVTGPQLGCDAAVDAALAILPAVRPEIALASFHYSCFDELNPDAAVDCLVQRFGIVEITYVGGAQPTLIGVRLDETSQPKAFVLLVNRPAADDPGFTLERTPADLGCDAMAPPYQSFVIHIDPTKAPPVWAIADTRARLRILWGANDRGLSGTEPVVVDGFGRVLVQDGTRIDIPDGAWPSVGGRFVCPGPDAVYITDQPAPQP